MSARGLLMCALLTACSGTVEPAGPGDPPAPVNPDASTGMQDAAFHDSAIVDSPMHDAAIADSSILQPDRPTSEPVFGEPGCGFDQAAFCDTFDGPAEHQGRAGELDARVWSAGHIMPSLPTANGLTFGVPPATLPPCRPDAPTQVFPNDDALICDPNDQVPSSHLMLACGAQNYGMTSLRIRQPFDFAGRTGTIAFDADAHTINALLGWISIAVTEDPMAVPSFAVLGNDEGGVVPRNGFEMHMQRNCPDGLSTGVRMIATYAERRETIINFPEGALCLPTKEGHLNRFEIRVSQSHIAIWASPYSEDGVTFAPLELLMESDVSLPFTRGYVVLSVHNHATIKYSGPGSGYSETFYDAWVVRWDNVGFDGPVISNYREHEIPDSLEPLDGVVSVGYRIADAMDGPSQTFAFEDVSLDGVVSARIAQTSYYLLDDDETTYVLRYRLNGLPWHDRLFDEGELHAAGHNSQGAIAQILDVPVSELREGQNTLELVTQNVPQSYPPASLNMDLVLTTE